MANITKVQALSPDKYLSDSEYGQLRQATEARALLDKEHGRKSWLTTWHLVDLALSTGMRVAEITNLRVSDLSLSGANPHITATGKGNKQRDIFISKPFVIRLREYTKRLKPSDYVLSMNGKQYTRMALQSQWYKACSNAGIRFSIHSARHTYGFRHYRDHKDLRGLQQQLGHTSVTITAIYASPSKDDITAQVNHTFK